MFDDTNYYPKEPTIHKSCQITGCVIGEHSVIGRDCELSDMTMGRYTFMYGAVRGLYTNIGSFASIALYARLNAEQHPTYTRIAQHNFTYRSHKYGLADADDTDFTQKSRGANPLTICNDVWIGQGAVIMGGITLGNGCVVGANAVVTHDVLPYEVVGGVPARHIKFRFNEKTQEAIERSAWWTWDDELLSSRLMDFKNIDLFCEKYGG